jgi:hypothetical protein
MIVHWNSAAHLGAPSARTLNLLQYNARFQIGDANIVARGRYCVVAP